MRHSNSALLPASTITSFNSVSILAGSSAEINNDGMNLRSYNRCVRKLVDCEDLCFREAIHNNTDGRQI